MYNVYAYEPVQDIDLSDDFTSEPIPTSRLFNYSVEFAWSGAALVGEIALEISNDKTHWQEYQDSPTPVTGANGQHILEVNEITTGWVRLVYRATSGTGSGVFTFSGKGW